MIYCCFYYTNGQTSSNIGDLSAGGIQIVKVKVSGNLSIVTGIMGCSPNNLFQHLNISNNTGTSTLEEKGSFWVFMKVFFLTFINLLYKE